MTARKLRKRPKIDPERARRLARRHSRWLATRIRNGVARIRSLPRSMTRRPLLGPKSPKPAATAPRFRFDRERARRGLATTTAVGYRLLLGFLAGARGFATRVIAYRHVLFGVMLRGAWWGALALLVLAGPAVFDPTHGQSISQALSLYVLGLGICAVLVAAAGSRHLRWAAAGLGLAHGSLAVVVVTALGPGALQLT